MARSKCSGSTVASQPGRGAWAERFFTPLANPHLRPAEVHWSYTLATDDTPDAIRYLYRSASYDLDTVETRAYAVVRLRLPTLSPSLIEDAANEILLPPASGKTWKFHFLESLSEGSRFSSDLSSNPLDIASWEDLVEGGIRSGVPYFMRFKKHPQRHGYPGLGTWFDAGFSGRAV
ncbi:MAG: hypothetical protein JNL62_24865 [Bryobacterales bacterium]|nr:hypothetical protein [Bryobacterales bacterium]